MLGRRFSPLALAVLALLLVRPGTAAAADLQVFAPAPAGAAAAAAPAGASVVALAPGAARALSGPAGETLAIEVAPGVVVRAERRSGEAGPGGAYVWSGDVPDDEAGAVDLVVRRGAITGQVTRDGRTWTIVPTGTAGLHAVAPVVPTDIPEDRVLVPPGFSPPRSGLAPAEGPAATSLSTAKVLIAYTPAAKRSVADIAAQSNLAVSLANGAFRRSGANLRLKLAGTMEVKYDDVAAGFQTTLTDATNGAGKFKAVRGRRETLKADFVVVLTASTQYCGLAWLGPSAPYAYSVTSTVCIPYHTFAHELGHNIGLRHDRYVEAKAPNSQFNFGFVNKKGRIRDIMSYANACSDVGLTCDRVPMFSTPKKKFNGKTIGIGKGKKGAAFATRTINDNRRIVAAFR